MRKGEQRRGGEEREGGNQGPLVEGEEVLRRKHIYSSALKSLLSVLVFVVVQ